MSLQLLTYNHIPKRINVENYVINGELNETYYELDQIVQSGAFSLFKDLVIKKANEIIALEHTGIKLETFQHKSGNTTDYQLKTKKRHAKHDIDLMVNVIKSYSNLTPNDLLNNFKNKPYLDEAVWFVVKNLSSNITSLYDFEKESFIGPSFEFNSTAKITFESLFNTRMERFTTGPFLVTPQHIARFETEFKKQSKIKERQGFYNKDVDKNQLQAILEAIEPNKYYLIKQN